MERVEVWEMVNSVPSSIASRVKRNPTFADGPNDHCLYRSHGFSELQVNGIFVLFCS